MRLPGGASFWNFAAFPVIAAAAFQVAIIFRASEFLGQFFFTQSVIAIALSLAGLQPRTWNAELRVPSRLRWCLFFSLGVLAAGGLYFAFVPSPLGIIVGAFLAKKVCDVSREFVFLSESRVPVWVTTAVTVAELIGIVLLVPGFLYGAILVYLAGGLLLMVFALASVRGHAWSMKWVISEVPHAIFMTLFNMGSRIFLIAIPAPAAHLTIGSLLQVVNFLSPVTFAIQSRSRRVILHVTGWIFCASAIFAGGLVFIWVGGGQLESGWYLASVSSLMAFSSSAVVRISANASRRLRSQLGVATSCWVLFGALLGLSGLAQWEVLFLVFLLGNSGIIMFFGVRGGFGLRARECH